MKLTVTLLAVASGLFSATTLATPLPQGAALTINLAIADTGAANPARPYVAAWLEGSSKTTASQWALWTGNQTEWLKDLRTWWRKFGRYHVQEIDGYSSATRAIGAYQLSPQLKDLQGQPLPQGNYTLYIEAVREHGGRDIVRQKINLGTESLQYSVPANAELGPITIKYKVK
ncbi:DUF2271 domain-containing protein [Ferrimonas sp. SCSIO 43195]|uniref:DUF2271 domain-containing protein n=1 Tax=Ferrimonas sp. SCSIO 43195 TaxID=2822844 RepID=UPI00207583A0|nr:DUF2271 domain-containing protein [Ferrimonas sp. SCSIO 43195]USD39347.1 DUF2271 domain-containing protein [Ferrimonas sp. SCSIO 43195]